MSSKEKGLGHISLGRASRNLCHLALPQAPRSLRTSLYLLCLFLALCSAHNRPYQKCCWWILSKPSGYWKPGSATQGEQPFHPLGYILMSANHLFWLYLTRASCTVGLQPTFLKPSTAGLPQIRKGYSPEVRHHFPRSLDHRGYVLQQHFISAAAHRP